MMSIAIDGYNLGNGPWSKTCSMTYRTPRKAAPDHRSSDNTSSSMLADANYSEGI